MTAPQHDAEATSQQVNTEANALPADRKKPLAAAMMTSDNV